MEENRLQDTLDLLVSRFSKFLNMDDQEYLDGLAGWNGENREKILSYKNWDWFQGVGLYGIWKYYDYTKKESILRLLTDYYERELKKGLPGKNINSVCPLLTLCCMQEHTPNVRYYEVIEEWAAWIMDELPRTQYGGFQHITSESKNNGQLWADTVFMTVLFLAKAGVILKKPELIEQAKYQMMLHATYLGDTKTGLWYHGWTFEGNHNFANAFWARGNCWITIAIPELMEILGEKSDSNKADLRFLRQIYCRQVQALLKYQSSEGLWHTILDDSESYLETSGSAGIAAGILMGKNRGIFPQNIQFEWNTCLQSILNMIDDDGNVHGVSIGTPMGNKKEFYKTIPFGFMAYGQALCIVYLVECLKAEHPKGGKI